METVRISTIRMLQKYSRFRLNFQSRLWVWLAEAEKELGLNIPDEAISQLKANIIMTDKDFKVAAAEEK